MTNGSLEVIDNLIISHVMKSTANNDILSDSWIISFVMWFLATCLKKGQKWLNWHCKTKKCKENQSRIRFDYKWSFSECDNFWTCCSSNNPCKEKEGDCDTNDECINDLTCGVRNCGPLYPASSDCCENKGRYSNALINMTSNARILLCNTWF